MKHLSRLVLGPLLVLSLVTSAFATEVPDNLVVENLNGQQRMVKTYVLAPDVDPATLQEPSFDYEGYHYSWAYTTKEEQPYLETKAVTQTVTVETASKDLSAILEQLKPSIAYDDGEYTGDLALDHTTLVTEPAGYTTKYATTTETKVIGNLDRNDMSYVPATTVKNGKTLSLVNVDWQVTGTDLVGDALIPSRYQAVATYSASSSYQAATGYVTTAEYAGEVTAAGIDSVTYTVVYTGEEIAPEHSIFGSFLSGGSSSVLFPLLLLLLIAGLAVLGAVLFLRRKNVLVYVPGGRPQDYKLVKKFRVKPENPEIDISDLDAAPASLVAVEIKRSLAEKLPGRDFTVIHAYGTHRYQLTQHSRADWHEFELKEEVPSCETDTEASSPAC